MIRLSRQADVRNQAIATLISLRGCLIRKVGYKCEMDEREVWAFRKLTHAIEYLARIRRKGKRA